MAMSETAKAITATRAVEVIRDRVYALDNNGADDELRAAIDKLDQGEFWSEVEAFLGGR